MSKTFDDIISTLNEADLAVVQRYILSTVKTEFAGLIAALEDKTYEADAFPAEQKDAEEIIRVSVTGPMSALRAFASVMAEDRE